MDWTPSVGWSADLWVPEIVSCGSADLCVAGSCFIFCVYRILTVGQIRSWVSTTSDADQV